MKLSYSIAMPAWVTRLRVITSKCKGCNRSLALRNFSAYKAGIRMHGDWYCSSFCFATAAEMKLSELLVPRPEQANHVSRMPIGLIFISRGLLTSTQLREATERQKEAGGEIGELLVECGFVSERQVTAMRAEQWGCPVFSVPKHVIQTGIQIPEALIRLYSAIPLHYAAATNRLLVGFVGCIEYGLLYSIEQMTGCKTQPCFVTPSDFHSQMDQRGAAEELGGATTSKELMFESVQTPAAMADSLCKYSVDLEADEALMGRCREYIWARLKYGPHEADLLFKAG